MPSGVGVQLALNREFLGSIPGLVKSNTEFLTASPLDAVPCKSLTFFDLVNKLKDVKASVRFMIAKRTYTMIEQNYLSVTKYKMIMKTSEGQDFC